MGLDIEILRCLAEKRRIPNRSSLRQLFFGSQGMGTPRRCWEIRSSHPARHGGSLQQVRYLGKRVEEKGEGGVLRAGIVNDQGMEILSAGSVEAA